jgi:hypothetical protein
MPGCIPRRWAEKATRYAIADLPWEPMRGLVATHTIAEMPHLLVITIEVQGR